MAYKKYRSKSKNDNEVNSQGGEEVELILLSKRHLELQIKTLQNAHRRDVDKLRQRLKEKEREKQRETTQIEVTQKG